MMALLAFALVLLFGTLFCLGRTRWFPVATPRLSAQPCSISIPDGQAGDREPNGGRCWIVFAEPLSMRKLAAAVLMAAGVALIFL